MLSKINQRGGDSFIRDTTRNPPKVRSMLERIGNEPVQSIQLVRTPLALATKTLLNVATAGQLEEKLRDTNIDKLFHLSMWINNKYNLEKNEVISLTTKNPVTVHSETLMIPTTNITIGDMIKNTMAYMGNRYGSYDAVDNNCSVFVDSVLKANGLQNDNGTIFCHQRVDELFTKFPSLTKYLTDFVTTTGAFVDRQIQGEGRRSIKL